MQSVKSLIDLRYFSFEKEKVHSCMNELNFNFANDVNEFFS